MKEREELVAQAKAQGEVSPQELAQLFNPGSVAFRLLGHLLRQQDEVSTPFLSMDFISEEGRLNAIKQQGRIAGRSELIDSIIDLILEGTQDDRPDATE